MSALDEEAARYDGTRVASVYVGGGTPSFLDRSLLRRVTTLVRRRFRLPSGCEWTLEWNPEDVDEEKAALLVDAGVSRMSLGVQTFSGRILRELGRPHDGDSALRACELLRRSGCRSLNIDLMIGLPGQRLSDLRADLNRVADLGCEHVSLYALTLEAPSRFERHPPSGLPSETTGAHQYDMARLALGRIGLRQYEVGNFARPGYASIHNRNYWRGGDYIGLGMGAHSHRGGRRTWNVGRFVEYLQRMAEGRSPVAGGEVLAAERRFIETLVFGLRMTEGVDLAALERCCGWRLDEERCRLIDLFVARGLLERRGSLVRPTFRGMRLLDELAVRLI